MTCNHSGWSTSQACPFCRELVPLVPKRADRRSAREVAHELTWNIIGTFPGRCTDEDEPDDVHSITCDKLTEAIELDRATP